MAKHSQSKIKRPKIVYPHPKDEKKPKAWLENKILRVRSFLERRSSRASRLTLLLVLLFLLSTSLCATFLPKDQFQVAKDRVLKNPNDFEAHLILAEQFLNHNQLEETERELVTAYKIQASAENNQKVLGLTSWLNDLWTRWQEQNPKELEKLITKWRKIVAENLEYRDGYLRLSIYYFKLGDDQKAKENLQKAVALDPNFEVSKTLEKIIR
jgi:tetratricopeptide (TPR) repeat protein